MPDTKTIYKIAYAHSIAELEKEVQEYIDKGYYPHGSMICNYESNVATYIQPIIGNEYPDEVIE